MEIKVNGESRIVETGLTVRDLLKSLGVFGGAVAVELNGDFLEDEQFESSTLQAGDKIEIVRFVGGG